MHIVVSAREIRACIAFATCVAITVMNLILVFITNTESIVTNCLGLWEFLAIQSTVDCIALILFILAICCSDHSQTCGEISTAVAALTVFMTLGTLCFAGCGALIFAGGNDNCVSAQKSSCMIIVSSIMVAIDGVLLIIVTVISVRWVCNVETRPAMATVEV